MRQFVVWGYRYRQSCNLENRHPLLQWQALAILLYHLVHSCICIVYQESLIQPANSFRLLMSWFHKPRHHIIKMLWCPTPTKTTCSILKLIAKEIWQSLNCNYSLKQEKTSHLLSILVFFPQTALDDTGIKRIQKGIQMTGRGLNKSFSSTGGISSLIDVMV
jgi:hypothetical protein